jgi:hypothetical protein
LSSRSWKQFFEDRKEGGTNNFEDLGEEGSEDWQLED